MITDLREKEIELLKEIIQNDNKEIEKLKKTIMKWKTGVFK